MPCAIALQSILIKYELTPRLMCSPKSKEAVSWASLNSTASIRQRAHEALQAGQRHPKLVDEASGATAACLTLALGAAAKRLHQNVV